MSGGKKRALDRIRKFKQVRTWQLVLILIPLIFLTATLLRFDHLQMVDLRNAVIAADESGDEKELLHVMDELSRFVHTHIIVNSIEENGEVRIIFGTGPFYLEQSYLRAAERAIEEAESRLSDDSNPYGNIYAAASAVCRPQAITNGWSWNSQGYLDCWMNELNKYPESTLETNLAANVPSTELYRHNLASPVWTLSWSGILILVSAVIAIVILVRFIIWFILHISLLFVR